MKKGTALLLILSMMLTLASCGSAASENTDQAAAGSANVSADDTSKIEASGPSEMGDASAESIDDLDEEDGADSTAEDGADNEEADDGSTEDSENNDAMSAEDQAMQEYSDRFMEYFQTFPAFTTENMYGETVTEEIFARSDITMVNIWGTYCPPCKAEMPYLEDLFLKLPDNAQIVGLVIDISPEDKTYYQDGMDIIAENEITYENILVSEDLMNLAYSIMAVPTSVFVDSEGKLVGKIVIGADPDAYISQFEEFLDGWTYAA